MQVATHAKPEMESLAHVAASGWHQTGKKIEPDWSPHRVLAESGLDWTVSKRPVSIETTDGRILPVKGKYALTRDSDDKVFDIVGSQWKEVQNEAMADFFADFVREGDLGMHAAGATLGGKNVFMVAELKRPITILGRDRQQGLLCFTSPHAQGYAVSIDLMGMRLWCANQIRLQMNGRNKSGSVKFSHVAKDGFDAQRAKKIVTLATEAFGDYCRVGEALAKVKTTPKQVEAYLRRVWEITDPDGTDKPAIAQRERNQVLVDRLLQAHNDPQQPGIESGNGTYWHAANTVSYVVDHLAGQGSTERRFHSATFGIGADRKVRALAIAKEMAAVD